MLRMRTVSSTLQPPLATMKISRASSSSSSLFVYRTTIRNSLTLAAVVLPVMQQLPLFVNAFPVTRTHHTVTTVSSTSATSPWIRTTSLPQSYPNSRLYGSYRRNNNNEFYDDDYDKKENKDEGGIVAKALTAAKNVAKTFLPSSWFQSEEEKKAAIQRQVVKDEISDTLNEVFKGAPFPVRMLGKSLISPLLSNVMSGLAETMSEQQASNQQVLNQAILCLQNDRNVQRMLGTTIQAGEPYSQSSSTTSINGRATSRTELLFPVFSTTNRTNGGTCRLIASNGQIVQLDFTSSSDGQTISVNTNVSSSTTSTQQAFFSRNHKDSINGDDNIIEAEIIEKTKK